jgi:hypothetical protein
MSFKLNLEGINVEFFLRHDASGETQPPAASLLHTSCATCAQKHVATCRWSRGERQGQIDGRVVHCTQPKQNKTNFVVTAASDAREEAVNGGLGRRAWTSRDGEGPERKAGARGEPHATRRRILVYTTVDR